MFDRDETFHIFPSHHHGGPRKVSSPCGTVCEVLTFYKFSLHGSTSSHKVEDMPNTNMPNTKRILTTKQIFVHLDFGTNGDATMLANKETTLDLVVEGTNDSM